MYLEGWERTDIKWNDKRRLKVTDLKNNTDYEVKFYDYDTYYLRKTTVQNNSNWGKLKIKHPKLAHKVKNSTMPIYNFTVEEVNSGKQFFIENDNYVNSDSIIENILFPNPNSGLFTLQSKDFIVTYVIKDISGRIVESKELVPNTFKTLEINVQLARGVYFLEVNKKYSIKFISHD